MSLLDYFPKKDNRPHKHRHKKFAGSLGGHIANWVSGREWEAAVDQAVLEIKQAFADHDYAAAYRAIAMNFARHADKPEGKKAMRFREDLDALLLSEAKKLVEEARYTDFVAFIDNLSTKEVRIFTADDLAKIPADMLHLPGLVDAIKQKIIDKSARRDPSGFTHTLERLSALGVVPRPELLHIPDVRKNIERHLIESASHAESFIVERELWVQTGVITVAEANALPEVVERAKKDVIDHANNLGLSDYEKGVWIRAGVLTQAVADALTKK